jgi:hypothetical protein
MTMQSFVYWCIFFCLLFINYYLILITQDFGSSGTDSRKEIKDKFTPAIVVPSIGILLFGLLYLWMGESKPSYLNTRISDNSLLTGYVYGTFVVAVLALHISLYKVNLS